MPDELTRSLGMEGGGYHVDLTDADGIITPWILSDISLAMESAHVAWLKGKLRAEKIGQHRDGIFAAEIQAEEEGGEPIPEDQLKRRARAKLDAELQLLDHRFTFGEYSFGAPAWMDCLSTPDGMAKMYQLCLAQAHPETKTWSLDQVRELVEKNEDGFVAAMRDILPKALARKRRAPPVPTQQPDLATA